MKLAVSNIGWSADEESTAAELLHARDVAYVEVAPTKVWGDPLRISDKQINDYKAFWAAYGIKIVAFQSMLFGHPELTIFDNALTRQKTKDYLAAYIELAARVGAHVLVFGSPKNRQIKTVSQAEAADIAHAFFAELGAIAATHGVIFCIEPNAKDYDCNFITTAAQGIELVRTINDPGFGLHLDTGCMAMAGDDIYASIVAAKDWLRHFHISAPFLEPIEDRKVDHAAAASALATINYDNVVSIEMRPGDVGSNVERVRHAVALAQKYYC